ncbi:MAG TPA: YdcH family protein [Stellaceae bacterium]|nr:YdcH family protein [Stellaceae bacterium]
MSPSLLERIETLRARHRSLEEAIDLEVSRPLPNMEAVTDLKRQKLRIKDEIALLEHAQ